MTVIMAASDGPGPGALYLANALASADETLWPGLLADVGREFDLSPTVCRMHLDQPLQLSIA